MGMMMTGPTMREFDIIERSREDLCPQDTVHIGNTGVVTSLADMMNQALDLIYRKGNYAEALKILSRMLEILPTHFGALWQRAEALERFGELDNAVEAWGVVIEEATAKGYADLASAKARLAALENRK
jgi:tetratricopeptide (TPR) repeat protein